MAQRWGDVPTLRGLSVQELARPHEPVSSPVSRVFLREVLTPVCVVEGLEVAGGHACSSGSHTPEDAGGVQVDYEGCRVGGVRVKNPRVLSRFIDVFDTRQYPSLRR